LHLIRWSAEYLQGKGIEGGRLDAELLLADTLGTNRLQLYLEHDRPLTPEELLRYRPGLVARAQRRPLQYILGHANFRELNLRVDSRVLIPRPETEELVGVVLTRSRAMGRLDLRALDIGTGSGAIALSLALEGPFAQVVGTDVSEGALAVAGENRVRLGLEADVEFRLGNLFDALDGSEQFDVLVSNPPYVAAKEWAGLDPEVKDWEPRIALLAGGEEGTDLALAIVAGAAERLLPGGLFALEIGAGQGLRIAEAIQKAGGFGVPEVLKDLARRDRIVVATRLPVRN
jgi:release factor glutamine methyltransferase